MRLCVCWALTEPSYLFLTASADIGVSVHHEASVCEPFNDSRFTEEQNQKSLEMSDSVMETSVNIFFLWVPESKRNDCFG